MAKQRVVVIGADAAGMSAASQAMRTAKVTGQELEIVALERGRWTSYSACGIPYWVAGDVGGADELVARSPEKHRANGIDVRMRTEATAVDLDAGEVTYRDHESGKDGKLGFDQLILATGAVPVRPDLPGLDAEGVFGLQTLTDGSALLAWLERRDPKSAVVVGGGYIGIEVAEALHRRGVAVTVVDQAEEPMLTLDPDMGRLVHHAMEEIGIDVITRTAVEGVETDSGGRARVVRAGDREYLADVVVLGIGVRPATALAAAAGLPLGQTGGLRVDRRMQVAGHSHVWSAGDCVESFDRVSATWVHVALGTHANKQGRVLGTNLAGGYAAFPGIVRTAVSKVCDLEIARTGMREVDARRAGFQYVVGTVESTTTAGYMPSASPMTVKVLAERGTGRLLGVQIVGKGPGAAKRIDAAALALWNSMTAGELAMTDLSYAPPFSPVWDPVQIAARRAAEQA